MEKCCPGSKEIMTFEKNVRVCLRCGGGLGDGAAGRGSGRRGGPGSGVHPAPLASAPTSPGPSSPLGGRTLVAGLGCSSLSLLVCLSFISELELEGKCNLRRPTEGGKSNPAASRSASEHSSLPAGRPLLPAPPASWPGLGAGAAPHVIGVPGGWGVPRAGRREDGRGGRGGGGREGSSGRPASPPLFPAPQRLFLIRVAGAVPPGSRVFVNV